MYVERTMDEIASDPDEAEWTVNSYEFEMFQKTGICTAHEKSKENLKEERNLEYRRDPGEILACK